MKVLFNAVTLMFIFISTSSMAVVGFTSGVPVAIQKSDWSSLALVYVKFETPIDKGNCTNGDGVVILDSNPSSKAALSFAMMAQASGKKFKCYVESHSSCSHVTGSIETFPVCTHYPSVVN